MKGQDLFFFFFFTWYEWIISTVGTLIIDRVSLKKIELEARQNVIMKSKNVNHLEEENDQKCDDDQERGINGFRYAFFLVIPQIIWSFFVPFHTLKTCKGDVCSPQKHFSVLLDIRFVCHMFSLSFTAVPILFAKMNSTLKLEENGRKGDENVAKGQGIRLGTKRL